MPIYIDGGGGGCAVHAFPNNVYAGTTAAGGLIDSGTPIGLLLALTYPTDESGGSSTNTHNFNSDYGKNAKHGFIIDDGPGSISVDYSSNGTNFFMPWTMNSGDSFSLENVSIHTIRVSYVASTTAAYRIFLGT